MYVLGAASSLLLALGAWIRDTKSCGRGHHGDNLLSRSTVQHVDEVRERWSVPGMAVAIVASRHFKSKSPDQGDDVDREGERGVGTGKVQFLNFGTATHAGVAVDSDSLFCIASNSKLFTALAVLKMIDDGVTLPNGEKLSLKTKVKDVLPDWGFQDETASALINVEDLMSMRSGMPSHDFSYADVDPSETVRNMRNLRPNAEVRETFQYQNGHYVSLAHMVPTLTNIPFIEYVRTHFFGPLGMNSTTYNHTEAAATGHRTDGHTHTGVNMTDCVAQAKAIDDLKKHGKHKHRKGGKGRKRKGKRPAACHGQIAPFGWWMSTDGISNAGPGGVVSSARDVATWLQELLDPKILPPHLLEQAATPRSIVPGAGMPGADGISTLYGAGQFIETYRGHRVVTHTGGVPGQLTLIARLPEAGVGVAILTNDADFGYFAFYVAFAAILDDLLGLPPRDTESHWFERYLETAPEAAKPGGMEPEYGFDSVPGTYDGAGYATLQLQSLNASEPWHERFKAELPRFGLANEHVFVAPMDRLFSTHLVFSHWDGPHFNWTIFIAHDHKQGFGKGTRASGPAVITPQGIGMFGGFNAPGPDAPRALAVTQGVEEACEAWFGRT